MKSVTLKGSRYTKFDFDGQNRLVIRTAPRRVDSDVSGTLAAEDVVTFAGVETLTQLRDFLNECIRSSQTINMVQDSEEDESYELFPNCVLKFH